MKILFHLAHPAHYHLFKNVIHDLIKKNHEIIISYNEKDVLENLLANTDKSIIVYKLKVLNNIKNKSTLLVQFIQKNWELLKVLIKEKPDLILGTSIIISLTGKLLNIPNLIVNEDDFDIIKKTAKLGYQFSTGIICPDIIRTGQWDYKCIKYPGYHELAYLHPKQFLPNKIIVDKYIDCSIPYTIIRFAKLTAHHDGGIRGIYDELAISIISELEKYSQVYITSERELPQKLENYRITIDPKDIHHILAFASLYIGDSQTMAAECGVLGTPFIRFNDFVGRISYLDELENKYNLGFGIHPDSPKIIYKRISEIFRTDIRKEWKLKKEKMLEDKIDLSSFFSWLIDGYPTTLNYIDKINFKEVF